MTRKNQTPEETVYRAEARELLQARSVQQGSQEAHGGSGNSNASADEPSALPALEDFKKTYPFIYS